MRLNFTFNSFLFLFVFLFSTIEGFSQTTGDYRSSGTGNWTALASWQYYNGTTWVTPTSGQGYPGQYTGTGVVTIRDSHTITISANTPNSFTSLVVGEGLSGTLVIFNDLSVLTTSIVINPNAIITFEKNKEVHFPANTSLVINAPGKLDTDTYCSNNNAVYIGDVKFATCVGIGNSEFTFAQLNSNGGTIRSNPGSNSPICSGNTINLMGSYTGSAGKTTSNGTTDGVSYSWSKISGPVATIVNNTSQNASIINATTGTYEIKLTVTTYFGTNVFTDSKIITVIVNALPTAGLTSSDADNTFCSGTSVTFTATGGTNYDFRVGGLSVQNSNVSTYTTSALTNGQVVDVIVTNASGCTATSSGITNTVNVLSAGLTSSDADNTFCSGTSVTFTATGGTNYDFRVGGLSVQNSNVSTYITTALTNGQVVDVIVTNASGCTATSSGITNTVNVLPSAGLTSSDVDNIFCSGTSVTFTATGGTNYDFRVGGSSVQNSAASTYITTALTNGQIVDVIVTNASGCAVTSSGVVNTVNDLPSAPTAGTPTNPTCKVPTGSVPLNGLPASGTIIQTGDRNDSYTITGGGTQIITNLLPGTYYFSVENGSCTSASVSVTIIAPVTNTWSTGSWSDGTPTINQRLVFASNYTNANDVDLEGCSCQVAGSAVVTIKSGRTLKIENGVDVQPNASLIFENNASLVQINDDPTINSGNITYHRYTAAVKRYDFTYWSSPVAGQTLKALSPNTLFDKYYSYDNGWKISYYGTATMVAGRGYLIRAPQTFSITAASVDTNPTFIGKPNNGVVSFFIAGSQVHLLGNPYPSAIDADAFLDENETVLEGTLYFWTHNSPPSINVDGDAIYNYTTNDYATYNRTGGVGTAPAKVDGDVNDPNNNNNLSTPNGKIAAGQGFFAPAKASGDVIFNNRMRLSSSGTILNNSQFFKLSNSSKTTTARTEKSRIWLNLTNKEGAYKQMLIGYITGATNNYDAGFDGVTYDGNQYVDFYSVNNAVNLAIQGRALPFVKQDSVALGYKSAIAGDFQISIDHVDGVLETQNIFLEDKTLNVLHDLRKGSYAFTTAKGVFNDRFVLRYVDKNAVEEVADSVVSEELSNEVVASVKDGVITVSSTVAALKTVIIYNVSGGIVYQQDTVNADELVIPQLISSHQVLVVTIVLSDGTALSRKIIY